ncbi:hypothetical protein OPV22_002752 [Ensete ventricosum]|uniref:Uncharacterized protein n=1 Tax=Ensete ventricosum TaxID=4639 RepID=A0AAV8RYY3_ENSVE|nr:hypothetical protein OPV22_002752 [Ensete ventricosum]
MKSSPAVSLFGAKAADSAIRRWLSPLLFLAVVALSIFLLYRVATPAVSFPPMTSVRVELSPPVAVWRPVAAAEASDLISSSSLPPVQWPVDAAVASDEEPISSAPSVQNIPESQDVRLERVLKAAATEDNTVILTSLNAFWDTTSSSRM